VSFQRFKKDPQAILDYQVDWTEWLGEDTIAADADASTWTAPAGITVEAETHSTTATTVWLSGGTAGQNYEVRNHIRTVAGREDDRTILVQVVQR
jgi:hypothetical protein